MKEIRGIIERYEKESADNVSMALATVVHVEDSSYRRSGARMLITEDGRWTGGISGGCLEGDTLKKAQQAIRENKSITIRYDTREDDSDQIGIGLGCNGLIDVLICPIHEGTDNQIEKLRGCLDSRISRVLITTVSGANVTENIGSLLIYRDVKDLASCCDTEKEVRQVQECVNAVRISKRSQTLMIGIASDNKKLFIEYLPPAVHLIIFGSNYDVHPLTAIAKLIGWKVTIVANPLKISKELYDLSDAIVSSKKSLPNIDAYTAALLMSHDYASDMRHLERLATTPIRYIGLLGPRVRGERLLAELNDKKIRYQKDVMHAPIGLDTGATTPEEIAISMIAEIRTHFSGRSGGMLRDRADKIND